MPLKPQNIIQAAEADLWRVIENKKNAQYFKNPRYMHYAFHREHVRRSNTAEELIRLALMDPTIAEKTIKKNTRMIYGNARLLLEAIQMEGGGRMGTAS